MNARPILFSAPMVLALISGRKSQTRRIVKPQPLRAKQPDSEGFVLADYSDDAASAFDHKHLRCPYGTPGDLLWVRETWCGPRGAGVQIFGYKATDHHAAGGDCGPGTIWKPSIHMPRKISRLTLRITDVRVQRLHEISEVDAGAEGVDPSSVMPNGESSPTCRGLFELLWDSINGPVAWKRNPWIWALTFEVIKENVDAVLAKDTTP